MSRNLIRKYVIPKNNVEKLIDVFNAIKFGEELITNIKDETKQLILVNNQAEALVLVNNFDIKKIELNNNSNTDTENNSESENTSEFNLESLLDNGAFVNEDSDIKEIISNHYNEIVDTMKTLEPKTDILIYEYPSEYRYLYVSGSENKSYTVRYTDYKLNSISELKDTINAFMEKILPIIDSENNNSENIKVTLIDTVTIDDYNTIQKVLKGSKLDSYIGLDEESNKIIQLIGSVEIILKDENEIQDIDTDNLKLLIIQFPKYLSGVKQITMELYHIEDATNEEDMYILKVTTPELSDLILFEVLKSPENDLLY